MTRAVLSRGDNVLMLAHSQFRGLFVGIARRLSGELGVRVHLYTATPQEAAFYQKTAGDTFAEISVMRSLYDGLGRPVENPQALYRKAAACEQRLDTTLNTIALTDRHFGRGFALGGYRHPRSRMSESADYPRIVRGILGQIEFWEGEVERLKPKLLINCGKTAAVIARTRGIAYRAIIGARVRNRQHWAEDEFGAVPELAEAYERASPELGAVELDAPYKMHMEMRSLFKSKFGLTATLKEMGVMTARHTYWRLRGYQKGKGYHLRENLGMIRRRSVDASRLARTHVTTLDDLKGQCFAYYPLHTEPEIALQGFSPEYFSQLACIASLARDLPAGTVLAVKETLAALGRRPRDFYEQIAEFKNVVLLRPDQLGLEVAKTADVTATITGTGGFEAAVHGRPVISFGRHNLYNILPHVRPITREEELAPALADVLSPSFDREEAQRNGRRFLNAVVEVSFDLEDSRILEPDSISPTALDDAFARLVASFSTELAAA